MHIYIYIYIYIGGGCAVLPYSSNEVDFASMKEHTTLMYVLKHDGVLKDNDPCHVQLAVLYTSTTGQRRVRVHNLAMTASLDHKIIFKHADLDAVTTCKYTSTFTYTHRHIRIHTYEHTYIYIYIYIYISLYIHTLM